MNMESKQNGWNVDRAVLAFAGCVVLISVGLSVWHHQYWLFLTAFAGLNMLQASITGFCPAAILFRLFGVGSGCAFHGKNKS